mmetsp:Transcript_77240/g.174729  ORF Transcript_77240/g.174729 Transcript_77240/m.174729 type:complete len:292 (+) Transcript_77240:57-932(+)|eukprot:CAMPEP_0197886246 /NCGR_PEP_ID=MMETSP1439-20131203/15921_1 /TAXON_ID=66791 /ORGANISM="Gonyaulax spinifera, Strain CCMP409" /LENGTH=291 /DNA_ID=CAMNT_0043506013 /DNA_START=57 /DNA_END=932 /DNA_ORIENTATION=-
MARLACPALCVLLSTGGAAAVDDATGLIQAAARSGVETEALLGESRFGAVMRQLPQLPQLPGFSWDKPLLQQLGDIPLPSTFDCKAYPGMCEAPFNCHKPELRDLRIATRTATKSGHANLRSWCLSPQYYTSLISQCLIKKDLKASGQAVYDETVKGKFGPNTFNMDASYCFIEGHCTNTAVTYNTTMEEAEQMCDDRYGHSGWAVNFGMVQDSIKMAQLMGQGAADPNFGFKHKGITKYFLKAACAMGNYHCDVVYCRDTYCKDENLIKKYAHLLPKVPGHLIQDREWVE